MDQIDGLIMTAAEGSTPAEWVKVCECLGLTVPKNDGREMKKAIVEELGQWKGSVMEEGIGLEKMLHRLQSAMDFAERPDLAGHVFSESDLELEQCQRELRQYYLQKMCLIPLQFHKHETTYSQNIEDIYVDLSLCDFDQIPSKIRKVPLKSHREMFSKIGTNSSPNRLVLSGLTGSGKTTLISKLAYEWATGSEESPLKEISLLFVLDMDRVDSMTNIEDTILTQLLPEDTKIRADQLKDYLSKNSSHIMVILDGCVKAYSPEFGCLKREGSLMKATSSKLLQECHIVVTTKSLFTKFDQSFRYVEVRGFSSENVRKYVQKFFAGQDGELGERLLSYISNSSLIHSITAIPLVLVELCIMWNEFKSATGIRTTQLFKAILNRITSQSRSNRNGKPNMEGLVKQVGKIAMESLPTIPSKVEDDRLSSVALKDDTTMSSVLKVACQMGIMVCTEPFDINGTDQMLVSAEYQMVEETNLRVLPSEHSTTYVSQVSFLHKTFQEYCAAVYLVSLYEDDSTQFFDYLETHNDVNKAIGIRSVLMFACGLSQPVADLILPGLLEIFTSQLEHSIKEYYKGELPLDESGNMQEFILLCLMCNYEADAADKFSTLLKKLVPVGQIKFVGITDIDAAAIAYFLLQSGPHNVHSIMLKAIPKPCEKLEPDEFWKTSQNQVWKTPMSKESLVSMASTHLDSFGCKKSEQLQVVASKTPMALLAHIQMYQSFTFLPSATPYTLDPILTVIGTVKLQTLDVRGFQVEKTEELLKSIEGGMLPNLSTLKLDHSGLKGHQMEKLATLLGFVRNLQELDLSNNKAGRCLSILGASLSKCPFLQVLSIRHMQAPASDMVTFLEMFSQFGSKVVKFHISGNETNKDVAHAFLDNVPKSCVLNDLGISVGDISRELHRQLIRGIQGLQSLQKLSLSQSSFPDDLLICTGEMLKSAANITSLSVDVDLKVLPQIEHSTWVDFKSKLIQANHLKKLNLHNIALETGDFKELLQVGHQCNLEQLRYFTGCLPDGFIIEPDHEFLELL